MESEREDSATLAGWFTGLKRQFPLHRLALFGSMARGETLRGSDIDILADVEA